MLFSCCTHVRAVKRVFLQYIALRIISHSEMIVNNKCTLLLSGYLNTSMNVNYGHMENMCNWHMYKRLNLSYISLAGASLAMVWPCDRPIHCLHV